MLKTYYDRLELFEKLVSTNTTSVSKKESKMFRELISKHFPSCPKCGVPSIEYITSFYHNCPALHTFYCKNCETFTNFTILEEKHMMFFKRMSWKETS